MRKSKCRRVIGGLALGGFEGGAASLRQEGDHGFEFVDEGRSGAGDEISLESARTGEEGALEGGELSGSQLKGNGHCGVLVYIDTGM